MFSAIVFSVFSIILTFEYASSEEKANDFFAERTGFYNNDHKIVQSLMILLWVFTGLTIVMAILDSNLVFFHLWLIKNNLTTYEYILRRREKSGKKIDVFIYNYSNCCKKILIEKEVLEKS